MAEKYFYSIGRRKTSHATVRLYEGKGENKVNDKKLYDYFVDSLTSKVFEKLFRKADLNFKDFHFTARVRGGGINSQLEAVLLGVARSIVKFDQDKKKQLKDAGYLTRDPRMVERKKTGLKKARKAEQYTKR
ncbi:MAG: 30S ribosomal protein S9 [Candidatus Dojkabacteria bacterium]|nr:MAG: 30S ribosomal protein S9 [Candidatus Dojkabacteria bacterium]GIW58926.1 MAG: 30S ribosomal protein S9 [Candidatus Dojkabacteria bacterium]